jgi:hypothetical protein
MSYQRVVTAVFAVLLAVAGATSAFAQYGPTLRADMGFEFTAGAAKLPAGEYTLQAAAGMGQPLLTLRGEEGSAAAFLLSNAAYSVTPPEQSKLVFHKYGDQYFLAQIWVEGSTRGWQVPAGRSERELGKRAARYDVVTILARR